MVVFATHAYHDTPTKPTTPSWYYIFPLHHPHWHQSSLSVEHFQPFLTEKASESY
jgi:hypothetical protein